VLCFALLCFLADALLLSIVRDRARAKAWKAAKTDELLMQQSTKLHAKKEAHTRDDNVTIN
jgi:hypothetical protein